MMTALALCQSAVRGGGWDPSAAALFTAMTTPPTAARQVLINNCIRSLKAAGVWAKLDVLHVMAAETSQAALLNWINPAQLATLAGTVTFTADRGMAGDGTTGSVATGLAISGLAHVSLNSAAIFAWPLSNSGVNSKTDVGASGSATLSINSRNGSNIAGVAVNSVANSTLASASSIGLFAGARSDAVSLTAYKNGASLGTVAQASTTLGGGNLTYGSGNGGNFSNRQIAAAGAGAGDLDQLALYNALQTYLHAIGAV